MTTVAVDNDIHRYLKIVQMTLYNKYNVKMDISDILSYIIKDTDTEEMSKRIFEKKGRGKMSV